MSIITDFVKDIIRAIIPQPEAAEPTHTFRWRQTVAGLLMLLTISQILFGVWALNQLPGTVGFASQKDMAQVQQFFHDFRETQLIEAIDRVRVRQCIAIQTRNQAALDDVRERLRILNRDYRALMGFDYAMKSCMELLVDTQT